MRKKAEAAETKQKIEKGDGGSKRRRSRQNQEMEVDQALATEIKTIIQKYQGKEVDKKQLREDFPAPNSADVRAIIYWDRDAAGVKIRADNGSFTQRFYFGGKVETIAVPIFLAKKMCDKLLVKEKAWWMTQAANDFEQLLRSTALAASS